MKKKLKRLTAYVLMLAFLLPGKALAAEPMPNVTSPYYAVMDANSGEILFGSNLDTPVYPASTAKLVTAMVVLDAAPLERVITLTDDMLSRVPSDASTAKLKAGGSYTVCELLYMFLVSSAADAGWALAEGCFGSAEACVARMNEKAVQMGLVSTHFDNVAGLDAGSGYYGTFTTPSDFAVAARHAMTYDAVRIIVNSPYYVIGERTNNGLLFQKSTNAFFSTVPYNQALYYVTGAKTGTTKLAGRCLVATATDGLHEVICVSYGNPSSDSLYQNVRYMLDYTYTLQSLGTISLAEGNYHTWFAQDGETAQE